MPHRWVSLTESREKRRGYDTDGDEVRNIDEINRGRSTWDGRHRVLTRTFPEIDQEVFAYDANDNVSSLMNWPKSGSPLFPTTITATYEPTWNHLASITDALPNMSSCRFRGHRVRV